jgi:hypothetical protein
MEACLEKVKANSEKTKAGLEEMEAAVNVVKERLKKMNTTDLEANQEKLEVVAVHQEVRNEKVAVQMNGALKDWSGERRLAIRCRRLLTRCAIPARREGHSHK